MQRPDPKKEGEPWWACWAGLAVRCRVSPTCPRGDISSTGVGAGAGETVGAETTGDGLEVPELVAAGVSPPHPAVVTTNAPTTASTTDDVVRLVARFFRAHMVDDSPWFVGRPPGWPTFM